ncbi:uncharacterized protein LOC132796959 [Drosophila nasuta]|uniref:uncharacterized protein LOC132796959 n=1 Tax=Drosophila nasuta TaxID=42062 RepID=UPI00295F2A2F|nr:uncharacterized protein LOC132796959 [Drosophila nasuta]
MRHEDIITIDQLNYRILIAKKVHVLRDRWNDRFGWFPAAQKEHYKQYAEIYKESLAEYGEEQFKKYAKLRSLRAVHTAAIDDHKLDSLKEVCCYPMTHMTEYRPSVTTNGEYGLVVPGHHHRHC